MLALNLSERNCLWTSNSGYSSLLWNDALCKSIANFHFIDKSIFHMPLKALVLITHTVSMVWSVSISLSVWHNGTQSTIDRRFFLTSICQAHENNFLPTDILHNFKFYASVKKRVCYSFINRNINATLIQCWPIMWTWMLVPNQSILNQNITYEPTKTTSLLAL